MAHWAEINADKVVIRVIVTDNSSNDEGQSFVNSLGGTWVKTSYSGSIRKNFAGVGMIYDQERDAFISPKPFDSWILNEETCRWESPTPRTELDTYWDESSLSWVALEEDN